MTQGIYRAYAIDGVLLYVGRAVDIDRRITEHRSSDGWWSYRVSWFDVEPIADYEEMCAAERAAIQSESPRYNRIAYGPCNRAAATSAIWEDTRADVLSDFDRQSGARRELYESAAAYKRAHEAHEQSARVLRDAVRTAFSAGVEPKNIVKASGLSRTTIYEIRDGR